MLNRTPPCILFVDDQPEVTDALKMAFRKQPFDVRTANSAQEAFTILGNSRIDAVISDEQMPVMPGSKFLAAVRHQYPDIVRIVLSGQADMKATLAAINEAQAHRFLLKPCPPNDIALGIAQALDERDQHQRQRTADDQRTEVSRIQMNRSLDAALDSLWMAMQPIVRSSDSELFGYEALIRSDHLELSTPSRLFKAAEEAGKVEQLERLARRLIARRIEALRGSVFVMVNVHPRSLGDDELYSLNSPLFPHRNQVILEITERDKVDEVPDLTEGLARLRNLGYRVAVDDLGAGYAGLNSFALIRPDVVKFDMELIRNIHRSPTKRDLVHTISNLCRDMGILTVAEGIESVQERDAATRVGCDLLQGFFISRPMRVLDEIEVEL